MRGVKELFIRLSGWFWLLLLFWAIAAYSQVKGLQVLLPLDSPAHLVTFIGHLLGLGLGVIVLILFFRRDKVFPGAFLAFLAANGVLTWMEARAGRFDPFGTYRNYFAVGPYLYFLFFLWVFRKSERIKHTFVR